MNVNVDVEAAVVLTKLRNGQKRFAFAVSNAINSTAHEAKDAIHARVRSAFQIRKPAFFFASAGRRGGAAAKISEFANPIRGVAFARISIGDVGGGRLILPGFETGAERRPFVGSRKLAAPVLGRPARPSIGQGVPPAYTFAGLKLRPYRAGKLVRRRKGQPLGGDVQLKGLQRTFEIPDVGVFQRFGKEPGDIRLLWGFLPPFALERRLHAEDTVERIARARFSLHLAKEIEDTLRFNRGR